MAADDMLELLVYIWERWTEGDLSARALANATDETRSFAWQGLGAQVGALGGADALYEMPFHLRAPVMAGVMILDGHTKERSLGALPGGLGAVLRTHVAAEVESRGCVVGVETAGGRSPAPRAGCPPDESARFGGVKRDRLRDGRWQVRDERGDGGGDVDGAG